MEKSAKSKKPLPPKSESERILRQLGITSQDLNSAVQRLRVIVKNPESKDADAIAAANKLFHFTSQIGILHAKGIEFLPQDVQRELKVHTPQPEQETVAQQHLSPENPLGNLRLKKA